MRIRKSGTGDCAIEALLGWLPACRCLSMGCPLLCQVKEASVNGNRSGGSVGLIHPSGWDGLSSSRVDPSHGSAAWTTRLADEGGTTLAWAEEEEEAEASIVIA